MQQVCPAQMCCMASQSALWLCIELYLCVNVSTCRNITAAAGCRQPLPGVPVVAIGSMCTAWCHDLPVAPAGSRITSTGTLRR